MCMLVENVDVLNQRFLRAQFESGLQAIGHQINPLNAE